MVRYNGRRFARLVSSRNSQQVRLRTLLMGTALGGSLAVIAAAAPTPANAACSGPADAVVCTAGEYTDIFLTNITETSQTVTLESGVVARSVSVGGFGDIHFTAEPDTSITGGVSLATPNGSIITTSDNVTGSGTGVQAQALAGSVTIDSTFAETAGAGLLPAAIFGYGHTGVVIDSVDAVGAGIYSHAILGESDAGTVSIVSTGEASNSAAVTGVGIGGVGRLGVTIDSNIVRTEGGYSFAPGAVPAMDLAAGEFVGSAGIHGRSQEGDVAITSNDIATLGDGGIGIYGRARAGDVTIDSTRIATQGDGATAIFVTAAQDVSITSDEITTAGGPLLDDGAVRFDGEELRASGILVRSSDGDIAIDSGSIETQGQDATGIDAIADVGSVDVTSDSVHVLGRAATGIFAWGEAGVTVDSGSVTTEGQSGTGILAIASGGPVSIASDSVHTTNGYSTGISASGAGVTVESGSVVTEGAESLGIELYGGAGAVTLTSGTVDTAATGIQVSGASDVVINSGSVVTSGDNAFGFYVLFNDQASITSESVETSGFAGNGIVAYNGEVTIDSGSVTTTGDYDYGIFAEASDGAVSLTSDTITATGDAGGGLSAIATGDVMVDSGVIDTSGGVLEVTDGPHGAPGAATYASNGMFVWSKGGDVDISSDDISTLSYAGTGINAEATVGDLTIDSGEISTAGDGAAAILAEAAGAVTITSQSASTQGDTVMHEDRIAVGAPVAFEAELLYADAIRAESTDGDVTITSGAASTSGLAANAIYARSDAGDIAVDSGSIETQGDDSAGIDAETWGGSVNVTSESVHTAGAGATGISALTYAGLLDDSTGGVTVESESVETEGEHAVGIAAMSATGPVLVTSDSVHTTGATATGIMASSGGALTVDSGSVETEGAGALGIDLDGGAGAVTVTSDTVHSAGTGIQVVGGTDVSIDTGSVVTSGDNAFGLFVYFNDQASVTSQSVETSGYAGNGIVVRSGTVTVDSGSVTAAGGFGYGVFAEAVAGAVSLTSDTITATGDAGGGLSAIATGDVMVDSGVIETSGGVLEVTDGAFAAPGTATYASAGMFVWSKGGDVDISSDEISTLSYAGTGINAEATAGDLTIDSGEISTAGDGAAAILANAAGAVTITSQSASTEGDTVKHAGRIAVGVPVAFEDEILYADAIHALSTDDAVSVISGTVSTSGLAARGIDVSTHGGAITIDAGLTTTSGDGAVVDGFLVDGILIGPVRSSDAIRAISAGGDITITSDEAHAAGAGSTAIYANTTNGAVSITSGTATGVTGGVIAFAFNGTVDIDSGEVEVAGQAGSLLQDGVHAEGVNGVSVKSGSVVIHSDQSYGVLGRATNGAVAIESGAVTTTGAAGPGVGAYGLGDVTVASGDITTTGAAKPFVDGGGTTYLTLAPGGLFANSDSGDVEITSGSISTQGEYAFGLTGRAIAGAVAIESDTVATTGDGAAAVVGLGAGDVAITSASASTAGDSAWITGELGTGFSTGLLFDELVYADAVHAESTGGAVSVASESASAGGLGARAIHAEGAGDISILTGAAAATGGNLTIGEDTRLSHAIFATTSGGDIEIGVDGVVSSAEASGVYARASAGAAAIDVDAQASVSGAFTGIDVEAASGVAIVNRGRIENTATTPPEGAYAAISIVDGGTGSTIVNSGVIVGAGPAISLDGGDDTVTLETGSAITGAVMGGEGVDIANLSGSSATATETQTVAHFVDFEQLNVDTGYWIAGGDHQSAFDSVVIGADGALEVRDYLVDEEPAGTLAIRALDAGGEYESALATSTVVNDGVLALNLTGGAEDTDGLSVTGAGVVVLNGSGTVNVTSDTIAHTGGTVVDAGKLMLTTGALQGDMRINQGGTFQIGDGGTDGAFAGDIIDDGTLIFNRSDYYEYAGALSGSGSLVKMGDSQLFLSGDYAFTGKTTVLGGTLKLAHVDPNAALDVGGGELDLSGGDHEVAGLSGDGGQLNIDQGSLTVNVAGTDTFAGEITGDGSLTVSGGGRLNLTGDNTYTGDTQVQGGTLKVNGSIVSDVFVEDGGTLGGNGTVSDVSVGEGGTIGAGNSIGLLNVAGDLTLGAGSVLEVEVNAAGQGDRIVVSGQAQIEGGTVEVLAEAGTYDRLTTYEFLTAAGGVDGEFDEVTSNFAYLTPSLDYTDNAVLLTLARNDLAFSALALGANQVAVADAVQAAGEGTLYDAVLFQSDEGADQAFQALSGEFYGSATTALLAQSRYAREAALGRLRDARDGSGAWVSAYGAHQTWDADSGQARARNNLGGVMVGADAGVGAWRVGAAVGQERSRTKVGTLASSGETQTTTLAAYGGFGGGPLSARFGLAYAMHDVQADREVTFPTFADTVAADYDGATTQVFGEAGYKIPLAGGSIEPFANIAAVRTRTDAFTEDGGASALSVEESERDVVFASVGARFTVEAQLPYGVASPYLSLAYGDASGDTDGVSAHAFDTGEAFTVTGAGVSDNAVLLDTGFDWLISDYARAGFGYQGAFGDDADEQSARVEFSLKF